jgi:hypothetical protein
VAICGDLSYADAEHSPSQCNHPGGCSQQRWDSWGELYQKLGAVLPTMTIVGNHEIETPAAPRTGLADAGVGERQGGATTTPFLSYASRFGGAYCTAAANEGGTPLGCPLHHSYDIGWVTACFITRVSVCPRVCNVTPLSPNLAVLLPNSLGSLVAFGHPQSTSTHPGRRCGGRGGGGGSGGGRG